MHDSSDPMVAGMIVGALVAGGLCGILPFCVARHRRRPELGWVALAVCLVSGLALGLLLAIPAALACTGVILALERGKDESALDVWQGTVSHSVELTAPALEPSPTAADPADRPAPPPGPSPQPINLFARSNLKAGEVSIACPKCGNAFAAAVTNLPPWCTRCGADLPRRRPEPAAEPTSAPPPADAFRAAATADAFPPVPADAIRSASPNDLGG